MRRSLQILNLMIPTPKVSGSLIEKGFGDLKLLVPFKKHHLVVPTRPVLWPHDRSKRASVNSFGIGGTNAHVSTWTVFWCQTNTQQLAQCDSHR